MRTPHQKSAAPGIRASSGKPILAGACIVVAAFAVYANSFSGPFIFDDFLSITQNPTIRSWLTSFVPPGGGVTVTGRPLLNLSFALNHALSGDQVWSYHALNLLIHVLAGLTLFGIVRRTLVGPGADRGDPAAPGFLLPENHVVFVSFAVALLWTVHPLQTESVTYIVQRGESLMGLFYLLTLYCFIRGAGEPRRTGRWFALSSIGCLLGMATKEVMVSVPVIVLLYDRTFLAGSFGAACRQRGRFYLVLAATWIPLAALVLFSANRGGTAGFGVGVSFWTYAATQFQAIMHYLRQSVWPHPLILDYGVQWVDSAWDVVPYAAAVTLLLAATVVALVRWPAFGFLGVLFFAILAPTSLVPGTRQTLSEHRMYVALAPVLVLLVLALRACLGRWALLILAAAVIGLGWLTVERNTVYHSSASIWRDTVAKRPGNAAAHNNYGNILAEAGQFNDAMTQYAAAIRLDPVNTEGYYNAGNALKQLGRFPEAIAYYERALQAKPKMPDAQTALGMALQQTGRTDEAIAHFEEALRIDPNYAVAHNLLGVELAKAGHLPEAIAHLEQALRIDSAQPEVHNNLGNTLRAAGKPPDAIAQYEEALRLRPDFAEAHYNLGRILAEVDRLPEAISQLEQALRINPAVPQVHNSLGMVLLMAGRTPDGIAHFEQALRLDPNVPQVHLNLAMALESVGKPTEAAVHYETARRLGAAVPGPRN